MRNLIGKIPAWLRNKYVLTALGFTIWILFIDDRDFISTHFRHNKELHELETSKQYYEQEILSVKTELDQLKKNPATLEKYAREKYRMKKDNEDVFLVPEAPVAHP